MIRRFGFRQKFSHFRFQLRLYFTRVLIRQRAVAAGVGVDLGPVQRHRAHFQHAHLARQLQDLDELPLDLLQKAAAEGRDRVVVGMVVRGDEAKRHRIICCPFQLAARKHAGGIAIDQHAQQWRRVVGRRTGTAVGLAHGPQVEALDHLHHKAR